ncbi:hypothetical protein HH310_34175 [Actinoplanes sp. TBRC 11911]|uniref:NACHT domain-containing protein n=1 Tax=Actinoplanes sp. TBRC 11911 TaxID=2729386 RepID=UPI00145F54CF|nr:hypothetical protein [Actinoplanes sp. TBRC 11911]NMO56212.1 hypothetical protein [Actinoplanes sp. TBRC 11911]
MPRKLTYADAVKVLGGSGPLLDFADNVLGGLLSVATAGGSEVALSLFDAKAEVIRLGRVVTGRIRESVTGLGRYQRSERLRAAHGIVVVSAFFEAFDERLRAAGIAAAEINREEQLLLAAGTGGDWFRRLLAEPIPSPSPDRGYEGLRTDLGDFYARLEHRALGHLRGLAVWEDAERARGSIGSLDVAGPALDHYESSVRRLALDVPEFAIWMRQIEDRAIARGLETLEKALLSATSGHDPVRRRAELAAAYRAELDRPVLAGATGELVMPTLAAAYVDPPFRVKPAGPGAKPGDESWWDTPPRDDLAEFLAFHLTTPQSADAPLLLLGQPGAGKSALTRILAARLPAADFLVVRVVLREVRAEAEIQDQIEQALRSTIGQTVEWAALAESAEGAMPVVLLDGFDELLQVTGVHQSDYLRRVAAFQEREKVLNRPVAVVVTSRIAVADRAAMPPGGLAVRLEPFDEPRIERWLSVWNAGNAGRLTVDALRPYLHLATEPLLLLMLALYDAAGNSLQDEDVDAGRLYERLLHEFAAREVRRVHDAQPEEAQARLIEEELQRLSVVALAMFHRGRLWATGTELDADLAALGLGPSVRAPTESFRTPLTAAQEMVGRFFFIQRAQAYQDEQTLQTYEFLHATFGEFLVARLVVQAVRDASARWNAGTLSLGQAADDGLVQTLLPFTPLSARATVLPFIEGLVDPSLRPWLIDRLRSAVLRPAYSPGAYQPVDRRADFWMSTYSFNLLLLTLACGSPVRASELFRYAKDPAGWLRNMALQWRAAVPSGMWLDAVRAMTITRTRTADDRRDIELALAFSATPEPVDPLWSHHSSPERDFREMDSFGGYFGLEDTLKSIHLTGALSDDVLRHVVQPLIEAVPYAVTGFARHGPGDAESIAASLVRLWVTSGLGEGDLLAAYQRVVSAVTGPAWGPPGPDNTSVVPVVRMVLRSLTADAGRLPVVDVARFVDRLCGRLPSFGPEDQLAALECVAATTARSFEGDQVVDSLSDMLSFSTDALSPAYRRRMRVALDRYRPGHYRDVIEQLDS